MAAQHEIPDEVLDAATLALVQDYEPGWNNILGGKVKDVLLQQYRSSVRAALEAALPALLADLHGQLQARYEQGLADGRAWPNAHEDRAEAWAEGYAAAETMARCYGHTDHWEDAPMNPYGGVS